MTEKKRPLDPAEPDRYAAAYAAVVNRLMPHTKLQDDLHAEAAGLTMADLSANAVVSFDRDDIAPLHDAMAALLGLDARSRWSRFAFAKAYRQHVKDHDARSLLDRLVKYTAFVADEFRRGDKALAGTDDVRVDRLLDLARTRGWIVAPSCERSTVDVDLNEAAGTDRPAANSSAPAPGPSLRFVIHRTGGRGVTLATIFRDAAVARCGSLEFLDVWTEMMKMANDESLRKSFLIKSWVDDEFVIDPGPGCKNIVATRKTVSEGLARDRDRYTLQDAQCASVRS